MPRIEIDIDPREFARQFDWLLDEADAGISRPLEGLLNLCASIRDALEESGEEIRLSHDSLAYAVPVSKQLDAEIRRYGSEFFPDSDEAVHRIREAIDSRARNGLLGIVMDEGDFAGCRLYIDPVTGNPAAALPKERVVEYAQSITDKPFRTALDPTAPPAHFVAPVFSSNGTVTGYAAVCNDGNGLIRSSAFALPGSPFSMDCARGYAWGMNRAEIARAEQLSVGHINRSAGTVSPGVTEQGAVFKDAFAFAMKSDEICYIPESAFEGIPDRHGRYRLSDLDDEGYTYADILGICGMSERIAAHVFESIDWQHPESYYLELEPEDLAELEPEAYHRFDGIFAPDHDGGELSVDIGFIDKNGIHDETELNASSQEELFAVWMEFCNENSIDFRDPVVNDVFREHSPDRDPMQEEQSMQSRVGAGQEDLSQMVDSAARIPAPPSDHAPTR